MEDEISQISKLFKAVGHEARMEVLLALDKEPLSAKELAGTLKTSQTYIYKHLQRLMDANLITRDGKEFVLSAGGRIFINSIDGVKVVARYKDVWENRMLESIPTKLLRDMGLLLRAKSFHPAPEVITHLINLLSSSKNEVLAVVDQVPPKVMMRIVRDRIKKNVKFRLIVRAELSDMPGYLADLTGSALEMRTIKSEYFTMGAIVVDNRDAGILFLDAHGNFDWNHGLYSNDIEFVEWAKKIFQYMYAQGDAVKW